MCRAFVFLVCLFVAGLPGHWQQGIMPRGLQQVYEDNYARRYNAPSTTTTVQPETTRRHRSSAQEVRPTPRNPLHVFIPPVPRPEEVECYIEIQRTERRGGRCTQLGGSQGRQICQSGKHFEFSDECSTINRQK